jgi:hypothetical protein
MSQDYHLSKIYDSLLKQQPPQQKPVNEKKEETPFQPLTHIYQQLLTERVGIYAKPIGQEVIAPNEPGMKTLGVADNEQYVQNALNSVTVKPATDNLLKSAGNWDSTDDYEDSLKLPIAMAFANKGFTSNDINKLIAHKPNLKNFVEHVVAQQPFNAREVVTNELQGLYTDNEHLDYLFDYVFAKKPKIADVGVGMGEVALTIFTNCVKGKVGDLDSSAGPIEVKSTGGRLAAPAHINYEFAKDLANFLNENKAIQKTNRHLFNLKNNIIHDIDNILNNEKYNKLFTENFKNYVRELANTIDASNFEVNFESGIFGKPRSMLGPEALFKIYSDTGYINEPELQTMQSDYQKEKSVWVKEAQQVVKQFTRQIRDTFLKNIFKKRTVKGAPQRKIDYAISTQKDVRDIAAAGSLLRALEEFYFTDFGLTAEQKAQALTVIVNKNYREVAERFKPEIVKFFSDYETDFKRGSDITLKAAVFAMQVSVYAYQHFKYLFLISKATKRSIGLNAESFYNLALRYIKDSQEVGFSIEMAADERGGSQLNF